MCICRRNKRCFWFVVLWPSQSLLEKPDGQVSTKAFWKMSCRLRASSSWQLWALPGILLVPSLVGRFRPTLGFRISSFVQRVDRGSVWSIEHRQLPPCFVWGCRMPKRQKERRSERISELGCQHFVETTKRLWISKQWTFFAFGPAGSPFLDFAARLTNHEWF